MENLSQQQFEQVSRAAERLRRDLPEAKRAVESKRARKADDPDLKRIESAVREAMPDEAAPVIERRVEELIAVGELRPSLLVHNDDFQIVNPDGLPDDVREALLAHRDDLKRVLPSVGRIEVENHAKARIGTGFLVDPDIVVTNRHVAVQIGYRAKEDVYRFLPGIERGGLPVRPYVDFKEEFSVAAAAEHRVVDILHIEDAPGPDIAFLRIEPSSGTPLGRPIRFAESVERGLIAATIGYPAKDTRAADFEAVMKILGDVYDKKRLAPGYVVGVTGDEITHDCSTFGGNSGSPVLDVATGLAIGIHAGGIYPDVNYGVSGRFVRSRLQQVRRGVAIAIPVEPTEPEEEEGRERTPHTVEGAGRDSGTESAREVRIVAQESTGPGGITWEIPLRVTVNLGTPTRTAGHGADAAHGVDGPGALEDAVALLEGRFGTQPGIVRVKRGRRRVNGRVTEEPAVIVAVDRSVRGLDQTLDALPRRIGGFPVEVRNASADDLMVAEGLDRIVETVPRINYEPPPDLSLDEVDEEMFAVFHVSPDAGWTELQEFLRRTRESLTIGLYNFSTEHVKEKLFDVVVPTGRRLSLCLGRSSLDRQEIRDFEDALIDDLRDALDDRFRWEAAEATGRRLFAGHYHIKVAVRDGQAVWLSSGNWDGSNQPAIDPVGDEETGWGVLRDYNREWHAVLLNDRLARTFESYIQYDLESYRRIREMPGEALLEPLFLVPEVIPGRIQEREEGDATYFEPLIVNKRLRIQPLLSPDNFHEHVLDLVESAEESILLENQSFKWKDASDERFAELAAAVLGKSRQGIDTRIIIRSDYGGADQLEMLVDHGFRSSQIRLLSNCHTKGMVVDSARVLLGSHNWTDHGVLANRDASLIVHDAEVAAYFARIFEFDWSRATARVPETPPGVCRYREGDPVPDGYRVAPWHEVT